MRQITVAIVRKLLPTFPNLEKNQAADKYQQLNKVCLCDLF